jgi:hypothetical protein
MAIADRALYQAKESGRNAVRIAGSGEIPGQRVDTERRAEVKAAEIKAEIRAEERPEAS